MSNTELKVKGYEILSDNLLIKIEDIYPNSHIKINICCDICKEKNEIVAMVVITMLKDGTYVLTVPEEYPKDTFFIYGVYHEKNSAAEF